MVRKSGRTRTPRKRYDPSDPDASSERSGSLGEGLLASTSPTAAAAPTADASAPTTTAAASSSSASTWSSYLTAANLVGAVLVVALAYGVKVFGGVASAKIHDGFVWAETVVVGTSYTHLFYFLLVSMVLHVPAPLPGAMSAWAMAIGCLFPAPRAFGLLAVSFAIGVPMSFWIGRAVASAESIKQRIESALPSAFTYMENLRGAIAAQPSKLSFLLMWAPMATSLCPFMVGFVAPSTELRFIDFFVGAFPSKMLHFGMTVLLGIQAGSFAKAEDAHDGGGYLKPALMGGAVLAMMGYVHHALDAFAREAEEAKKKKKTNEEK